MLSVDEIMDDFRRNGQDCDFAPVQDSADRTWSYNPASPSWNAWPPEYYSTSLEKGTAFSVSNAHLKLARAISALSLSGTPTSSYLPQPQTQFCQHRGTNSNRCSNVFGSSCDPMLSAERADVLNFLQGNSLIHNELVKLIHEKAHALSQEHCLTKLRQDEANYLNSHDYLMWSNQTSDHSVPIQAPRNVSTSRGRTRTNNWERYESGGISGRSSPIPRDIRFEMRPCQTSPRVGSSSRYLFNRTSNPKHQRDVEMDRVSNDSIASSPFSPPTSSGASFTPTTPESLNSSEETVMLQEAPIPTTTKPTINGSGRGRKASILHSPTATSSIKSSGDGSCPSSPETTPHSPMTPRDPPNAPVPAPKQEAGGRPKGSQNRRRVRYSSESQQTGGCAFCKKNGETPSVYKNHIAKDAEGQTVCDILQKYVCPLCGATGKKAHTVKYCPSNLNPHPSPPEKFRSSRGAHLSRPQKKSANGTH